MTIPHYFEPYRRVLSLYEEICLIIKELSAEGLPATDENISLAWSVSEGGETLLEDMEQQKILTFQEGVWRLTPIGEEFVLSTDAKIEKIEKAPADIWFDGELVGINERVSS